MRSATRSAPAVGRRLPGVETTTGTSSLGRAWDRRPDPRRRRRGRAERPRGGSTARGAPHRVRRASQGACRSILWLSSSSIRPHSSTFDRPLPVACISGVWDAVATAMDGGVIVSPSEVLNEIKRRGDPGLYSWANDRATAFVAPEQSWIQHFAEIETHAPHWFDGTGTHDADPFVFAQAKASGLIVVTYEGLKFSGSPAKISTYKRSMPHICSANGRRCRRLRRSARPSRRRALIREERQRRRSRPPGERGAGRGARPDRRSRGRRLGSSSARAAGPRGVSNGG